jgi:hypothetical protein
LRSAHLPLPLRASHSEGRVSPIQDGGAALLIPPFIGTICAIRNNYRLREAYRNAVLRAAFAASPVDLATGKS